MGLPHVTPRLSLPPFRWEFLSVPFFLAPGHNLYYIVGLLSANSHSSVYMNVFTLTLFLGMFSVDENFWVDSFSFQDFGYVISLSLGLHHFWWELSNNSGNGLPIRKVSCFSGCFQYFLWFFRTMCIWCVSLYTTLTGVCGDYWICKNVFHQIGKFLITVFSNTGVGLNLTPFLLRLVTCVWTIWYGCLPLSPCTLIFRLNHFSWSVCIYISSTCGLRFPTRSLIKATSPLILWTTCARVARCPGFSLISADGFLLAWRSHLSVSLYT